MVAKVALLFCAQALLAQNTPSEYEYGKSLPTPIPFSVDEGKKTSWDAMTNFCEPVISQKEAAERVITSQCIGNAYNGLAAPWGAAPYAGAWTGAPYVEAALAAPCAAAFAPAAANGGGFQITSASPIAVTGLSLTSENAYEGPLSVSGAMPFLGAVALEGALPTAGAGAITYGCGSGNVAMLSEGINAGPYGYGAGAELGYGYAPLGYEAGIAAPGYGYGYNRGCGCGAL